MNNKIRITVFIKYNNIKYQARKERYLREMSKCFLENTNISKFSSVFGKSPAAYTRIVNNNLRTNREDFFYFATQLCVRA